MWRWLVLWQACVVLVGGTIDFGYFTHKRYFTQPTEVNCMEPSKFNFDRFPELMNLNTGRRRIIDTAQKNMLVKKGPRRIDDLLPPKAEDIVKEHAKLVQDINSLKQLVFVAPIFDDYHRDYDDSVFHEIIETTSTVRPTSPRPTKRPMKYSSIPIIYLGGASQRHVVKSSPLEFPKPTISLIGTTSSPALHPYPFVQPSRKPFKFCVPPVPLIYTTTTRRPSFWERFFKSFVPKK